MNDIRKRFDRYVDRIISGKIKTNTWIRLAIDRHINDLKSGKWEFDFDRAQKAVKFIELMPHVDGSLAGQKIRLEDWQIFNVASIFGWVDPASGFRRFREGWIYVPRKNGKSTLAGTIGLYMLTADGEMGAQCYCGATSLNQASFVFAPAWKMAKRTPALSKAFDLRFYGMASNPTGIYNNRTSSKFVQMIGNPPDGGSPQLAILDEYHEHKDSRMYDTMITGMGARSQPLLFGITTAGFNLQSPAWIKQLELQDVLQGNLKQDRTFASIYSLDISDDWKSDDALIKANPNMGVSVNMQYLRDQQDNALQIPANQSVFKTKHLNLWVDVKDAFLDSERWRSAGNDWFDESVFDAGCVIGVDLSAKNDVTAWTAVVKVNDKFYTKGFYYLPAGVLNRVPEHLAMRYRQWAQLGYLKLIDGDIVDYKVIENDIREFGAKHPVKVVGYDKYNASYLTQNLTNAGMNLREYGQQVKTFSEPMKELQAITISGDIEHDANPMTNWMAGNLRGKVDKKGNCYPEKADLKNDKIDGMVALIMGMGLIMTDDNNANKIISDIDIITL
jgi:phage terminase large subunit-like protein